MLLILLYVLLGLMIFGGLVTYLSIRKKMKQNVKKAIKETNKMKEKLRDENE